MNGYYVEWHIGEKLKSVLFDDHDRQAAQANRSSVVAPAGRSRVAKRKDSTRETEESYPVQGFQDLLSNLATLTRNRIRISDYDAEYDKLTSPTSYQQHVLALLDIRF